MSIQRIKAMLFCIVYAMLFVNSVNIYRETIKTFGGASLSCCVQHAACIDSVNIPWILQKLLFSHTSFWLEGFFNISNHLPDSSFA